MRQKLRRGVGGGTWTGQLDRPQTYGPPATIVTPAGKAAPARVNRCWKEWVRRGRRRSRPNVHPRWTISASNGSHTWHTHGEVVARSGTSSSMVTMREPRRRSVPDGVPMRARSGRVRKCARRVACSLSHGQTTRPPHGRSSLGLDSPSSTAHRLVLGRWERPGFDGPHDWRGRGGRVDRIPTRQVARAPGHRECWEPCQV